MRTTPNDVLSEFNWKPQPAAEAIVLRLVEQFLASCPTAARLRDRMREETGTRFVDWIDHLVVDRSSVNSEELKAAGFEASDFLAGSFVHGGGIFPPLMMGERGTRVVLKVDSAAAFAAANNAAAAIVGAQGAQVREVAMLPELAAIERHGYCGALSPWPVTSDRVIAAAGRHREVFGSRRREFADEIAAFAEAERLADAAITDLGVDFACDLFFAAEREYWQGRNRAAQFQKARQDVLGLGWANHDHHTYRSSRQHFVRLIALFEKLGFACRERFYAGANAGWGAQVLEQPRAGVVIFADVDLAPEELLLDFAHEALPARSHLGTVGLWCALHGEAILEAGMHHLECEFDFDALKRQLESAGGIGVMKPFTDLPYLRQAFTEGERWSVREARIARLLDAGQISDAHAAEFRRNGAIGSHLENLERKEGFKGFNQKGVSEIIAKTDPRKNLSGD